MSRSRIILVPAVFLLLLTLATAAPGPRKLPPGLIPCSISLPNLEECIMENAIKGIPIVAKGVPSYKLRPLDPLFVPRIVIDDTGSNRRVAINLDLKNVNVHGLGKSILTKVDMLPNSDKVVWEGRAPVLQLIGEYETSGRVLILPITGKGPMNFTLENVEFKYTFDWKKDKVRQGRDYVTAKNFKLTFETSRCHIQMDNLFNGDKRLSDSMNAFLNENWREMVEDLGPTIGEALNQGFQQIILTILDQVPFDSFFPPN